MRWLIPFTVPCRDREPNSATLDFVAEIVELIDDTLDDIDDIIEDLDDARPCHGLLRGGEARAREISIEGPLGGIHNVHTR